jgi:hypothetical protein
MNLEQVINQLEHLSSILERSWIERQVMATMLNDAKFGQKESPRNGI